MSAAAGAPKKPNFIRRGHLLLILHPRVAEDAVVRNAVERVRAEGYSVRVQIPGSPASSQVLVERAVLSGAVDTVVAGGGDGTIKAVATGLTVGFCSAQAVTRHPATGNGQRFRTRVRYSATRPHCGAEAGDRAASTSH